MCLTIPGKIESIDNEGMATVISHREKAVVDLSFVFDARPGDWVLYATNRAVKRISEEDAQEILELLEDNYTPVDVSKLPLAFKKIIYKVRTGNSKLSKEEILYLLRLKGRNNLETLHAEANFLRKERIKDFICIHGIIEFSNYCQNDCLYCGIRRDNKIKRYRMAEEEIIKTVAKAVKDGYKLVVLQSGEDPYYTDEMLINLIKKIRTKMRIFVFLSVGIRSKDFYQKAFEAGASGSLLRFEVSQKDKFRCLKPHQSFALRIGSIEDQMKIGYYMATGSLVGLPEQTLEDVADDLLFLQKLNPPMISAGPYIGAKNTPLKISKSKFLISNQILNSKSRFNNLGPEALLELTLKYIAIARFLLPETKIPVTTALETLDPEGRHKGLLAGANSLMFNLTPKKYSKDYRIYDNKYVDREKVWQKYGLFKDEESWEMLEERMKLHP